LSAVEKASGDPSLRSGAALGNHRTSSSH